MVRWLVLRKVLPLAQSVKSIGRPAVCLHRLSDARPIPMRSGTHIIRLGKQAYVVPLRSFLKEMLTECGRPDDRRQHA